MRTGRAKASSRVLAMGQIIVFVLVAPAFALPPQETAPIHFGTDLSADEESAPTESPARGHADFTLERDTLRFSWIVTFKGLTSLLIGAYVRGPQKPGTNAGVLFDLGPKGAGSPLRGSIILNDGQLEYLLAGRMYVNLHTSRYKDGEVRGQIKRIREKQAKSKGADNSVFSKRTNFALLN